MAPLAATVAATVAMGVGVALARAGRERIARRQRRREREFRLQPGEPLAAGLRRIALGQADLALEMMTPADGVLEENAVHETRKALKRMRALVRMLEEEIGASAFAYENATLRDIGRRLSGARDSEVVLATLEALIERHPRKLARRDGVVKLRRRLAAENERIERTTLADAVTRAEVTAELRSFRARVEGWRLAERRDCRLIEPGLERIYRQGRARHARVVRGKGDRSRAMHEWRKRVKDLRYAAEMLQRREPTLADGAVRRKGARKRSREAARLRRIARRADELGELLGEDHDLVLLGELLRAGRRPRRKRTGDGAELRQGGRGAAAIGEIRVPRRTRKRLEKLIAQRRRDLRRRALRIGERLYERRPRRFLNGVRRAYAAGQ